MTLVGFGSVLGVLGAVLGGLGAVLGWSWGCPGVAGEDRGGSGNDRKPSRRIEPGDGGSKGRVRVEVNFPFGDGEITNEAL